VRDARVRAAPLRPAVLEVRARERPRPVLADGRAGRRVRLDLAKRDDRQDAVRLAGVVDGRHVVALVERRRLRVNTLAHAGEQVVGERRLVPLRRLDLPRDREVGSRARGHVEAVAVEPAALPGGDSRAVSPGGVRVGEPLPLRAVLGDEPLAVRVRGEVGGVDSEVASVLGKLGADRLYEPFETCVERRLEAHELFRPRFLGGISAQAQAQALRTLCRWETQLPPAAA
jgi:hypothetical protein